MYIFIIGRGFQIYNTPYLRHRLYCTRWVLNTVCSLFNVHGVNQNNESLFTCLKSWKLIHAETAKNINKKRSEDSQKMSRAIVGCS